MKYCKHISFDEGEKKYLVREPAVMNPIMNEVGDDYASFRCSICNKSIPINKREGNRIRIKLIPKGYAG